MDLVAAAAAHLLNYHHQQQPQPDSPSRLRHGLFLTAVQISLDTGAVSWASRTAYGMLMALSANGQAALALTEDGLCSYATAASSPSGPTWCQSQDSWQSFFFTPVDGSLLLLDADHGVLTAMDLVSGKTKQTWTGFPAQVVTTASDLIVRSVLS